MEKRAFKTYKHQLIRDFQDLLDQHPLHAFDEQAVPSYIHGIPLARWLFWQRIRIAIQELENLNPQTVLDFGCGGGVLFPKLQEMRVQIYACDLDLRAARELAKKYRWEKIQWFEDFESLGQIKPRSVDVVIAFDVLEHVEESVLTLLGARFARTLKEQGRLLISGPTESLLYRIGRNVAGFTGHYHHRNIYHIETALEPYFTWEIKAQLYWPLTLFRILSGTPKPEA